MIVGVIATSSSATAQPLSGKIYFSNQPFTQSNAASKNILHLLIISMAGLN